MTDRTRRLTADGDDAGFTLIEVMVAMTILSIFFAIFGGSMISAYNSVNATQQNADAQSTVNRVFVSLDRQLRYASGIGVPATDQAGNTVVAFLSVYSGTSTCTQLRLSASGVLQERSWDDDDDTPTLTMTTLASELGADAPTHTAASGVVVAGPFSRISPIGSQDSQQLEVALNARDNRTTTTQTRARHFDVTFTAQNAGSSTSSDSVCTSAIASTAWPTS